MREFVWVIGFGYFCGKLVMELIVKKKLKDVNKMWK